MQGCIPRGLRFDHGIQHDEEFAHGGRERHLLYFASHQEPLVERFDDRVTACRGERRHLEDRTDRCPSAPDMPCARPFPALVIEWCEPHQLGNFALVEGP